MVCVYIYIDIDPVVALYVSSLYELSRGFEA